MPQGPLGGPRPLADCRISLLVYGHPQNPPSQKEVQDAINSSASRLGQYVNNVVEQNIDTDKIDNIASNGVIRTVVVEFQAGKAFSINQDGQALLDFNDEIMKETGATAFILAR